MSGYESVIVSGGGTGGGGVAVSAGSQVMTSGTVSFGNSNGVTFGLSNGTLTATVSVPAGGAALQGSGTFTQNTGTIQFGNSNGVSFGLTAGQMTASVQTNYQTPGAYLTTAALSEDSSKYAGVGETVGTIAGTDLGLTVNTVGVNIGYPKWITTYVNDLTSDRAGTGTTLATTGGTDVVMTLNTNGLALNYPKYITTYVNDLTSGRAGTGTTLATTAGTDIVVTLNTNGLALNYPKYITTYAAQTNQSGNVYVSSNTFGTSSGTYDARTVSIAGSGLASIAASNSGFVVYVPTSQSRSLYASSNTFGTSSGTYNDAVLSMAGSGGVSVAASNSGWVISVPAGASATGNLGAVSANGNSISGGTAVWSNSNNVSFGMNVSTITATATFAQTNQSIGFYAVGNTTNSSSTTLDARTVSIDGAGNALVGFSAGSIIVSVTGAGGDGYNSAQFTNSTANSTMAILWAGNSNGSGNITLGLTGSTVTGSASGGGGGIAAGVSNTGHTAGNTGTYSSGTIVFAGSSSLTLSQSTGAGGVHTIWLQPAMSQLQAGANISLSSNGSSVSVINVLSTSAYAQNISSVTSGGTKSSIFAMADHIHLGVGGFGLSNIGTTSSNTGTQPGTWVIAGSGNVTAIGSTGAAGVHTVYLNQTGGGGGGTQSIGMSTQTAGGGTGGTTGYATGSAILYHFVPGSNVTMSQSINGASGTISVYAPSPSAAAITESIGISTQTAGGSTAGTSGYVTGDDVQYLLVPGSNITMSQSVNGASGTLSIYGASGGGGAGATLDLYDHIYPVVGSTTMSMAASTSYIQPVHLHNNYSFQWLRFPASLSGISTTFTVSGNAQTFTASNVSTWYVALYSRGSGASSESLQLVASSSAGFTHLKSMAYQTSSTNTSRTQTVSHFFTFPFETGTSSTSISTTGAGVSFSISQGPLSVFGTGIKLMDLPFATTLGPKCYWLAMGWSTDTGSQSFSAATGARVGVSQMGVTQINTTLGFLGQATSSSVQWQKGIGSMTTNAIGVTASYPLSGVSSAASMPIMPFLGIAIT